MGWLKKTVLTLSAAGLGFLALASYSRHRDYEIVRDYVEAHIDTIVRNQEQKLGIKFQQPPKIKYDNLPDFKGYRVGYYYNGTVYLMPTEYITTDIFSDYYFDVVTKYPFFEFFANSNNKIIQMIDSNLPVKSLHIELLEDVVNHEIGHYYFDIKSKKLENGALVIFGNELLRSLIDQGVATYFEFRIQEQYLADTRREKYSIDTRPMLNNPEISPYFGLSSMESIIQIHRTLEEKYVGFMLVKPILDKSVEKGVEALIKNPLQESDLPQLQKYQRKLLDILAKQ